MNNFGLPEKIINQLIEYFKTKPFIEKVYFYGSRAKGTYNFGSDIDFAIWTDKHNEILRILSELYDLSTLYKFDVTDYKILSHEGMKKVLIRKVSYFIKDKSYYAFNPFYNFLQIFIRQIRI